MSQLPPLRGTGTAGQSFADYPDYDSIEDEQESSNLYETNFLFDNYKPRDFSDKEIEKCFNSFDLSKTGFLSASEIKRCFIWLGANVTDEDVDEMLKMCDTSGDGQVEYDEFAVMVYDECGITRERKDPSVDFAASLLGQTRVKKESTADAQNRLELLRARARDLKNLLDNLVGLEMKNMASVYENFRLMDDSSKRPLGLIDYPDFCACLDVEPNKHSQSLFNFFKMDEDTLWADHMDYRNFLISIVATQAQNLEQKIKFTFEIFDVDGNGNIDRNELMQVLSATQLLSGKSLADRVDQILRLADKDNNGTLEYEEYAICARRYKNLLFLDLQ